MILPLLFLFNSSCSKQAEEVPVQMTGNSELELRVVCPEIEGDGCLYRNLVQIFYYEGCPIRVIQEYYLCPDGIKMKPPVWTMLPDPNCQALRRKLSDEYKNPFVGPEDAMNLWNDIVRSISLQVQSYILDLVVNSPEWEEYACTENPCNPTTYTFQAQASDCIRLCAEFDPLGDGGIGIWNLSTVICGNGCCRRMTPFCMNEDGSICYGTTTVEQISACDPVEVACPSTALPSAFCSPPCHRL